MNFDPEKTQHAIHKHTNGDSLNPMNMLYDGQVECFGLIGGIKSDVTEIKETDAGQEARITALEKGLVTLQNRAWGLLVAVIIAVLGWFLK